MFWLRAMPTWLLIPTCKYQLGWKMKSLCILVSFWFFPIPRNALVSAPAAAFPGTFRRMILLKFLWRGFIDERRSFPFNWAKRSSFYVRISASWITWACLLAFHERRIKKWWTWGWYEVLRIQVRWTSFVAPSTSFLSNPENCELDPVRNWRR